METPARALDRHSFFTCLGGGFGDLTGGLSLFDTLDDTNGNGLSHVTDGESTEWWVLGEGFDAHWLEN